MDGYDQLVGQGVLILARLARDAEKAGTRRGKQTRVIRESVATYNSKFSATMNANVVADGEFVNLADALSGERRLPFIIDLLFVDPFAPNSLKYKQGAVDAALTLIAQALDPDIPDDALDDAMERSGRGLEGHHGGEALTRLKVLAIVQMLRETQRSAAKAHRHVDVAKMIMIGGGGLALVAVTAGAAAPFIGVAIGEAGGLAGAAALLHGLAVIGGGSLAAGGYGMAGGFWILTGAGALVGLAGGTTAAALMSLGAEGARAELIKLQTSFKHVILPRSKKEAADAIASVLIQRDEVRDSKRQALERNEDDAPVVKELELLEQALTDAATWMSRELERA
jgi:hypothetical protein